MTKSFECGLCEIKLKHATCGYITKVLNITQIKTSIKKLFNDFFVILLKFWWIFSSVIITFCNWKSKVLLLLTLYTTWLSCQSS